MMTSPSSSTSSLQASQAVELAPALEGAKLFKKARMLFRNQMGMSHLLNSLPHFILISPLVAVSGYQMADGQNIPWLTLSIGCAQSGMVCHNWSPDCRFPSEFKKGDKGIEGAPAKEIRALVAQFQDTKQPLTFKKVERQADKQGKLIILSHSPHHLTTAIALINSDIPVITTYVHGKPPQRRALFANNVVKTIFVDPKLNPDASGPDTSQAAALDPLPSSELTALEESSSSSPASSPSPEKPQPKRRVQPTRNTEPSKTSSASNKRTIHAVSPGSANSDGESPPKRANTKRTTTKRTKAKLPGSDSSMEISEIQPQPTTTGNAPAGRKKKAASTTKGKAAAKKRTPKSPEYIEDSDDGEKGKKKSKAAQDEDKFVPGACILYTKLVPHLNT